MKMMIAAVLLTLAPSGTGLPEGKKMSRDEAEVLRLEQEFIAAWNRGDAHAAAAVYADDGVRVGAFGDLARGRKEVEAAYAKLLGGPMKGATVEWQPTIRLLSADVAVTQGPLTITASGAAPPIRGYALDIWTRTSGRWRLVEAHPKLFPPPPR